VGAVTLAPAGEAWQPPCVMRTPRQSRVLFGLALLLAAGCRRLPTVTGASATLGDLSVRDAVAWGLASSRSTTIGFRVTATSLDTLIAVESPDGMAMLHDTANGKMIHRERLPVGGSATVVVGGGGPHIMLTDATHGYSSGDSVRIVLTWARSGRMVLSVPLKKYSDASGLLGAH
jgi:copper(I)-binding protein